MATPSFPSIIITYQYYVFCTSHINWPDLLIKRKELQNNSFSKKYHTTTLFVRIQKRRYKSTYAASWVILFTITIFFITTTTATLCNLYLLSKPTTNILTVFNFFITTCMFFHWMSIFTFSTLLNQYFWELFLLPTKIYISTKVLSPPVVHSTLLPHMKAFPCSSIWPSVCHIT